jgi:hypothetical protein
MPLMIPGFPSYYDSWALVDTNGKQGMTFAANPFLDKRDRANLGRRFPGGRIECVRLDCHDPALNPGGE